MGKSKKSGGMGFRNLQAFKSALLAKQAWRIMSKPDSLLSRMYKARYFLGTEFREAHIGSNASLSWKSICEAKELLVEGLRWRIGNGNDVKAWTDNWIPRDGGLRVRTPWILGAVDLMVWGLIDQENRVWKRDRLEELFWEEEVESIKSIPLGDELNNDRLV
ncbi:hypothetical protein RD792_018088 [Penstemon davidsonii]|uniref:Uncharacterized protein n=1 Tax=Penstemon davidsonii TaxID=160366 RepID=A0ABR0DV27_9LAMI|nr:hypothetical protein RD792_018088 [Penstemon davidsonii]